MALDVLDPPAPSPDEEEMPVDPPTPALELPAVKPRRSRFVLDYVEVPSLPPSLIALYLRPKSSANPLASATASGSGSGVTVTIPAPSDRPKPTRTFPVMDDLIWRKAYFHKDPELQRLAKAQSSINKVCPFSCLARKRLLTRVVCPMS